MIDVLNQLLIISNRDSSIEMEIEMEIDRKDSFSFGQRRAIGSYYLCMIYGRHIHVQGHHFSCSCFFVRITVINVKFPWLMSKLTRIISNQN